MIQVFFSAEHQKQFEEKGYVLFPSLLNKPEIEQLSGVFEKYSNEYAGFFSTTHFSNSIHHKNAVQEIITKVVFPHAKKYLKDFVPLFGNFMVKNPDPANALDMHSDWVYVDEEKFCSVAVWIPLVDVNEENGCFGIVEETHLLVNKIRGPLINQSTRTQENKWAKNFGKLFKMNAGDAIFYNHALLHYSPPNKTNFVRPAVNLSLAPATAEIIHYCMPEGTSEIEMYSVTDKDFFIHYSNFQKPERGKPIKKFRPSSIVYIDERMTNFFNGKTLWGRVKNFLSGIY